jgi:hypothetical protein
MVRSAQKRLTSSCAIASIHFLVPLTASAHFSKASHGEVFAAQPMAKDTGNASMGKQRQGAKTGVWSSSSSKLDRKRVQETLLQIQQWHMQGETVLFTMLAKSVLEKGMASSKGHVAVTRLNGWQGPNRLMGPAKKHFNRPKSRASLHCGGILMFGGTLWCWYRFVWCMDDGRKQTLCWRWWLVHLVKPICAQCFAGLQTV